MKVAIEMAGESLRDPAPMDRTRRGAARSHKRKPVVPAPELTNIIKTAVRIIAGPEAGEVARAAGIIGVSEPTLYRWRRAGNMRDARGAEILRVHELTGLPVELLLRG